MDTLRKTCFLSSRILQYSERICDPVLTKEHVGHEKPVFWHILYSDTYLCLLSLT